MIHWDEKIVGSMQSCLQENFLILESVNTKKAIVNIRLLFSCLKITPLPKSHLSKHHPQLLQAVEEGRNQKDVGEHPREGAGKAGREEAEDRHQAKTY